MVAAQVLAKYATEAEALGRLNHYGCSRAVLTGCKGLHWVGSCSMADTSQMPQMGGCMVVLGAVIGASGLHAQHVQRPSGGCNTCQGFSIPSCIDSRRPEQSTALIDAWALWRPA